MTNMNVRPHLLILCVVLSLSLVAETARAQTALGGSVRVSSAGPDGNPLFDATHDGSAYNSQDDQYLIVWDADTQIPGIGATFNGKREVFGRILNANGTLATDQTLLATAGPATDELWDAQNPEVAYNSATNEYYVAFVGTVTTNPSGAAKSEIFGLRVAANGTPIGAPVRLSLTGSDNAVNRDSREPSITYNSTTNEMLVVWQFEVSDNGSRVEHEIYARRVGADGIPVGNSVRVSTMGPAANTAYDALDPYVTYGAGRNEYLVVWRGDDDRGPLVQGEFEIFGQRLSAALIPMGSDDFRISQMGPNGNTEFGASDPAATYNPDLDEYLVTWTGTDDLLIGEEVYAQLLRSDGTLSGSAIQVSHMGDDGPAAANWMVDESLVSYSSGSGEYFVLWIGEDDRALLAVDEFEVFGQRLDVNGASIGIDDVRLSFLGTEGSTRYDPFSIDLAYNPARNEYLVVYSGDDNAGSLVDDEVEVFAQRIAPRLPTCFPDDETLCANGGRFQVTVDWRTSVEVGTGKANNLSSDSGWFWFFNPENAEVVIKVLDGRGVNGNYWVFFGALSNVEYVVKVLDTETGEEREYRNPQGTFASVGDTAAFPLPPGGQTTTAVSSLASDTHRTLAQLLAESLIDPPKREASAPLVGTTKNMETCVANSTTLCLTEGRFKVEMTWAAPQFGTSGQGQAVGLTSDTGWFWFFDAANTEVMVKVLDARGVNGNYWVFFGALSNVAFELTVTDTLTGQVRQYTNPDGTFASVGDVVAFPGS